MSMERTCFVIMPFGNSTDPARKKQFDDVYEHIIAKAVERVHLECVRCDKLLEAGSIDRKMIEHICDAAVAVVDITDLNANVFWELGVRQALRSHVTVLIRKQGTQLPFDIKLDNVIDYDIDVAAAAVAIDRIAAFIRTGLKSRKTDSRVQELLSSKDTAKVIKKTQTFHFKVSDAPGRGVRIVTGDILNIKNVPIWVNSENTNMQMARFFDRSISSLIRYSGAEKDEIGNVTRDVIADELAKKMSASKTVAPGTVVITGSGDLERTHGVKKIFHVAAVAGAIGRGYAPVENLDDCVTRALERANENEGASVLFPLLGAGTARGDLNELVPKVLGAAVSYFENNGDSKVQDACFLAYSERELDACLGALSRLRVTPV
jgi:O-acetyl-ADP-ribose deacetylase (regulator of RNase III)